MNAYSEEYMDGLTNGLTNPFIPPTYPIKVKFGYTFDSLKTGRMVETNLNHDSLHCIPAMLVAYLVHHFLMKGLQCLQKHLDDELLLHEKAKMIRHLIDRLNWKRVLREEKHPHVRIHFRDLELTVVTADQEPNSN